MGISDFDVDTTEFLLVPSLLTVLDETINNNDKTFRCKTLV